MGCHFLFQEIFPTQGLNQGFLHWRWILYQWSHQESQLLFPQLLLSSISDCWELLNKIMCMRAQSLSHVGLWDPVDCSPPGSSVHWISQVRVTGVGCHFLLEEIFPAWELNPSLLHWQASSLPLSHQQSWKKIIQLCKFRVMKGS